VPGCGRHNEAVPPIALFDLDNTLVDRAATYRRWAEAFASERDLGEFCVEWMCQADNDGFRPRPDLFAAAVDQFGLREEVGDLVSRYWTDYLSAYKPDPVVKEALRRLREAGWRIGIVTNGASTQHEKVARAELTDLVDTCCVSGEVGAEKPDSRIFTEALRRCGHAGENGSRPWMVGDAPIHDIGGGRELGLWTIWMHRGRRWELPDFRPELEVASVPEAVEIMLTW
jgi:putative hydrolase of the HAD superfamily